jgi:molybdate transport system substrate-binding protein
VLNDVGQAHERQNPGVHVVFNFAGSNELAQQILASPKADIYLSASEEWMDKLEQAGRLEPGTRRSLLSNRLVIVASRDSSIAIGRIEELGTASYRYLVLANPDAVPAGQYAKLALSAPREGGNLWDRVKERVLPMPDVRAALAQAERQADVIAIVYATDAKSSIKTKTLYEIPAADTPKIVYPVALIAGRPKNEAVRAFYDRLFSDETRKVYESRGFLRLP